MKPAQCWQSNTRKGPIRFRKGDIFVCCDAALKANFRGAATRFPMHYSVPGPLADAARCDLGLAGSFAALGSLALVNAAGEPIDQPQILLVGTLHPYEPRAHRRDQRRKQNCRRSWLRRSGWASRFRCDPAWPHDTPDIRFVFSKIETRPRPPRCLCFFLASGILE